MSKETFQEQTPKFINNTPQGADLFEGKSQERVAENIVKVLINDDKGQIIGIEGGWGSGKSNLIEIIRKKLAAVDSEKYHFFIYDAWGHQEDLQRRSLLEEITSFLTKDDGNNHTIIADEKKWNAKLVELLSKSKETQKKTIPSLSLGIVVSGILLILTPIFKAISESVDCIWLKVLITSIPIILLVALFAYYFLFKTEKDISYREKLTQTINKLFYLYQRSQKEETTYERISEDEPSVRKFRDWMKEISNDLKEKELVIVFDNMDRLPSSKVSDLWSSIHTFFSEGQYDNITVIIPFDRIHIKNAFEDSEKSTSYTNDFINKTFNIVYRVSPPILSDWRSFFEIKWKEAFGKVDDEYQHVVQIFDHLYVLKTPREIVAFINEFVSTTLINKEIPYRYIALFLSSKEKISISPEIEIITPSYLGSLNFLYQRDEELPKYIAALVYQIDSERALEIIFVERLTNALNNNNADQIKVISDSTFFKDIIGKAISQVANYSNTVTGLKQIETKIIPKSWDDLYERLDPTVLKFSASRLEPYHLIVLEKIKKKKEFAIKLIDRLRDSEAFLAIDYFNSIKELESYIKEKGINITISSYLRDRKTTPEDFSALLKEILDSDTALITCDNNELVNFLSATSGLPELTNSHWMSFIPKTYDLNNYISTFEAKIKANETDRATVAALYAAYKNVAKSAVQIYLTDNNIYSHFVNSVEPRDGFYYDLISMRIVRGNAFLSSLTSFFDEVLNKTDIGLARALANSIRYFIGYDELLINTLTFNKPLLKTAIQLSMGDPIKKQSFNLLSVLAVIDQIVEINELDLSVIIEKLAGVNFDVIQDITIQGIIPNINFFKVAKTINIPFTNHCIKTANQYFENLTDETWKNELHNINSSAVATSIITIASLYPTNAVSAIKETLVEIAKIEVPIPPREVWRHLIDKSNKSSIRAAFKNVRDSFINTGNINPSLFMFFGEWLFEFGELEKDSRSLRKIFTKSILEDEACANIILMNKQNMTSIYQAGEEKEDFDNEVRVLVNENRAIVNQIAKELNIEIANKNEESEK